jgi:hypothetical protein
MLLNPEATTVASSIVCLAPASTGATAGRIDYMPFGKVKLSQGDFAGHASRSASTISSRKNDIKLQATWRNNDNKDGVDGNDEKEGFIQARYVF